MYTMKKKGILHLFTLCFACMVLLSPLTIQAANDDPGAGRLSGKNIPAEFYEDAGSDTDNGIARYGALNRYGNFSTYSAYTKSNYSHQDQFFGLTIANGIDVSEWQGNIDWTKVKAAGIDFAFIRVGARGYGSAGNMIADKYYDQNMKNAIAAGVNVGIYVFSQAITTKEAEEEAQYILDRISSYNVSLPLVLDYEFYSGGRLQKAKLSKNAGTDICLAFCKKVEKAGYTPMVYANPDMLNNHLNADTISNSYPVWLANYTTNTKYTGTFSYWQYSSVGKVDGISGNVDMNFYYNIPDNHLAKATITPIDDQMYTEKPITPALNVTLNRKSLVLNKDYTVSYSYNTDIGTAKATITGVNGTIGTRSITFNITPGTMSAPTIKSRSKTSITIGWTKHGNASGYLVYRSNSLNGKYSKIATISKASTTSYKDTKVSSGEYYYYKVRLYVKDGGTKYSNYSPAKGAYTKVKTTQMALAKSGAKMYSGITTTSTVVKTPKKNDAMQIIYGTYDDSGNRWYRVSLGSTKGYVQGSKVKVGKRGIIKTSRVNVRKSRSVRSKKLTTLGKKKVVTVLGSKRRGGYTWYKVCFKKGRKTYNGYIASNYVKLK